jgi:hypothetical protein
MNKGKRPNQSDISRLSCSPRPNETDSQAQRCARLAGISGGNGGELSVLALLIAEQNVKFLALADRVYTLDNGRIGFSGTVAAMQENDALRRAYFGLKG